MKTKKESILGEAKKGTEAKKSKFGGLFSRGKTDEGTIIIDEAPAEAVKPTTQTTAQPAEAVKPTTQTTAQPAEAAQPATTVQTTAKQPTVTAAQPAEAVKPTTQTTAQSAAKEAKPAATTSTQPATAAQSKTATPTKQEAQATSSTSKLFKSPEVNPLAATKPAASQSTATAQPAAKAAKPAATASAQPKSAPATPASDKREIISNGKAIDGFEPERAKTDIALMISRFTDEMNKFTCEISSKFDAYSEQLEKLSERVGRLEEKASQSARPTVNKQGNTSSEGDVIKSYYFWDIPTRSYRVTTDIIAAIQLSQRNYQICFLIKEDGSYHWANEAEINEYLPDPPTEGVVKTYFFNGPDGKCHYHWSQPAAWQLSKSYNTPELKYWDQYWVWEGGKPTREATSDELGAVPVEEK